MAENVTRGIFKNEPIKHVLDRPAYVGMCILDLSKTLMYDFRYNYVKKKYGSN